MVATDREKKIEEIQPSPPATDSSAARIAVAINVCSENRTQLTECFRRVALNIPRATVQVFLNGEDRHDVVQLAQFFGFKASRGDNLGSNATWHLFWLRMLRFFASAGPSVCLKFDPDTMVDAVPSTFPPYDYFGTVTHRTPWGTPFVQGGITGLSKTAVTTLLDQKVLESGLKQRVTALPKAFAFADDQLVAEALALVGIHASGWRECLSVWKQNIANNPIRYAIVHPRFYK